MDHFFDIETETEVNSSRIFGSKIFSRELSAFRGGLEHAPSLSYMYHQPSKGYRLDALVRSLFGKKEDVQTRLKTLAEFGERRFFRQVSIEVSGRKYYLRAKTEIVPVEHGSKQSLTFEFVPHKEQEKMTEAPLSQKARAVIELIHDAPEVGPVRKGLIFHLHFRPGDLVNDFQGLVHLLFSKDYVIEPQSSNQ